MAQSSPDTVITLVRFDAPDSATAWRIINDGVMGGLSRGQMRINDDGTATFRGAVSLANNGGFASTRAAITPPPLSHLDGIRLRVRGDGKRYQLRFRMDAGFDGVSWGAEFDTRSGEWTDLFLAWVEFRPVFRGRAVPQAGPLDPDRIRQVGFLIGNKQAGTFQLDIAAVAAVPSP